MNHQLVLGRLGVENFRSELNTLRILGVLRVSTINSIPAILNYRTAHHRGDTENAEDAQRVELLL